MDKQDRELLAKQMRALDRSNDGVVIWTILATLFVFLVAGTLVTSHAPQHLQVAFNDTSSIPAPGGPGGTPSIVQ